jgi:short-subunit dehydrogenase
MPSRSIAGCRALLTGGSSGIGRALATNLVADGALVLAVARRSERLAELAASLANAPGRFEMLVGDIASPQVRHTAIERMRQLYGGMDLLVNNAGIGAAGLFSEAPPERLRQVMEVNFFAATEMVRLSLPLLKAGNRPMIVNVGSILGHRGIPGSAEYCASKFALQGFSESLRAELGSAGIDVLVVSPGTTKSEFFERSIDAALNRRPHRQGMEPSLVARRTIAAIRRGKHEIVVGTQGKLLVWANRLFPRLLDAVLARYG